ncbi:MAG: sodium ion-translocating decarboxylase subunit beta [Magnetococcales bacterium]|nr:sodium ion-translocating decarboxylase subunit beta [Magnetococcales bacterium]
MSPPPALESWALFWHSTGLAQLGGASALMPLLAGVLLILVFVREFEPVFLLSLGFAALLVALPGSGLGEPGGLLYLLYEGGVRSGVLPGLFFLGLGLLADFTPLIALPALLYVGVAAQLGVFVTLWLLGSLNGLLGWNLAWADVGVAALLGGANLPSLLFSTDRLAPHLLGPALLALYAGVALLPRLQPPLLRLLTTAEERRVVMESPRAVSVGERLLFALLLLLLGLLLFPAIAPLLALLVLGNMLRESALLDRLLTGHSATLPVRLLPLASLLLGLAVGGRLTVGRLFSPESLLLLGCVVLAFAVGTASGVGMGKWLRRQGFASLNPLLGGAGLAVLPLTARLAVAEADAEGEGSRLLPYAMATNWAGVVGSVAAAGILLAVLGGK